MNCLWKFERDKVDTSQEIANLFNVEILLNKCGAKLLFFSFPKCKTLWLKVFGSLLKPEVLKLGRLLSLNKFF